MGNEAEMLELMFLISNIIGGSAIGALCGGLPVVIGAIRKKVWLGMLGLGICIVFGAFMTTVLHQPGFLSVFPAAIMAGVIFWVTRKKKK